MSLVAVDVDAARRDGFSLPNSALQGHGSERSKLVDRIPSIDVLRGVAMIVMALNHAQIYFSIHEAAMPSLMNSDLVFFFTRWVTGFCAPIFVFLAGLAAYLQLVRGKKSKAEQSRFLFTRGLWLVLLELTFINLDWFFAPSTPVLQVFWALGASMMMLSALIWLPLPVIAFISIALIGGHNAFDHVHAASLGHWANLWRLMHETGPLFFAGKPFALVAYPLIPWNGIMALGFCFGPIMVLPAARRIPITALCGVFSSLLFFGLRGLHLYGDPTLWNSSTDLANSLKSFLNVSHNPVSLQFCAMSLGVSLLLLAGFDSLLTSGRALWLRRSVEVYGRVPLIYYMLHIFVLHLLTILVSAATGHDWHLYVTPLLDRRSKIPAGYGFHLPVLYMIWIAVVASLFLPISVYARYKREHPEKRWLSYL